MEFKKIYTIQNERNESRIAGNQNKVLQFIEEHFKQEIVLRHCEILIQKDQLENEEVLVSLFETLEILLNHNHLSEMDLFSIVKNIAEYPKEAIISLYTKRQILLTTISGKSVYPRTMNQSLYLKSLHENDIVFSVGPAGTGKTYLAVMYAIKKLKEGDVRKIVLVRPVVEAGEKLGFLPGDLKEKIDPYLIPLYDALYDALGKEAVEKLIQKGVIEVSPLAYMRGRTLENSIVILDEAQNTTLAQMKMFLTRLGFSSKMIITGDITQIDLPNKNHSGLVEAIDLLRGIPGIDFVRFDKSDVMRHPLLYKIIQRYEDKEFGN